MYLSKVYRSQETCSLKPHRFAEFGPDGETLTTDNAPEAAFAPPEAPAAVAAAGPDGATATQDVAEAFVRGRREAATEAEVRFGKAADALAEAVEEISRLRESILSNASQDMLHLVLNIARQVIQAELSVNSDVIVGTIDRALQAAVRADSYHLRVNEEDLELVTRQKPLFMARISGLHNLTIEADPEISRGGCRLESEFGAVDATIENQLDVIRHTLTAAGAEA